jgi:SAM-dependent methyltransferase
MAETPEFDRYADNYSELVRDPVRDRFAPDSRFFCERKLQLIEDVLRRLGLSAERMTWVDIGCGTGDLLKLGAAKFGHASGCDVSVKMLEQCGPLPVHHQREPDRLPFADGYADFVTAVCVYHHVKREERQQLTGEIRRILRPGGLVGIIEHNPINPATRLIVRRSPVDRDAVLLRAQEVEVLCRSSSMEVLGREYFLYLPASVCRRFGLVESALRRLPFGGQYAVFARRG